MKFTHLICVFILVTQQFASAQSPIIPAPVTYVKEKGMLMIDKSITIRTTNLPVSIQTYLTDQLQSVFYLNSVLNDSLGILQFQQISNTPKDAYTIAITDKIVITYSSEASCLYAINSFFQLLQYQDENYSIDKAFVQDYPNYQWRGMHLDVSRHFFSVEEVKRFIDLMALYKFNVFHWHLTDDQGWRIEIKKYPKLTEIGGFRDSTLIGHFNDFPHQYEKNRTGGFYTQTEISEVVNYAASKFISVVPEIEMPGHARAALAAYPELSCTGKQLPVESNWGVFDDIFCAKPATIDFLKDVLAEVIPLFPFEYIHIGGDEAPKSNWKKCNVCQQLMVEHQLKDEHALQRYFITQIDSFLTLKGKKIIGWDEILEGGLSPNAAVMSWRGDQGGIEAAQQEHSVVMSPTEFCYFDYYQSSHPDEPLAIGGYLPIEKVYAFEPRVKGIAANKAHFVLGGQANLWTEYISDFASVEYALFPRILAMSQVLWCHQKPSYEAFKKVVISHQLDYLKRHGINFSQAMLYPTMEIVPVSKGIGVIFKGAIVTDSLQVYAYTDPENIPEKAQVLAAQDTLLIPRSSLRKKMFFDVGYAHSEMDMTTFTILQHELLGLPVKFETKPSSNYNFHGDFAMVDGVEGRLPWKGSEWLGFQQDTICFSLDLLKVTKVKDLEINFLNANGSWIYVPQEISVFVSSDNIGWRKIKSQQAKEHTTLLIASPTRFVKVQVKALNQIPPGMPGEGFHPWTFIDEVKISKNK